MTAKTQINIKGQGKIPLSQPKKYRLIDHTSRVERQVNQGVKEPHLEAISLKEFSEPKWIFMIMSHLCVRLCKIENNK